MEISSLSASLSDVMTSLRSNPILPLIASGGITVWLISNMKMLASAVWNFFIATISFTVFNMYEDDRVHGSVVCERQYAFNNLVSRSAAIWERTKNLDLTWRGKMYDENDNQLDMKNVARQDVTYGFSIRRFLGKFVVVNRGFQSNSQKTIVNTSIRVFFASKKKFMKKLESAIADEVAAMMTRQNRDSICVYYGNRSYNPFIKNKRDLNSIFTNNDEHVALYEDIKKFIANKDVYLKMNYPYKYSAILYGVPGAGKSSTILAIASALNRDIHYINLKNQDAASLMDFVSNGTDSKIYVFEDIDALSAGVSSNRDDGHAQSEFETAIKDISPTSLSDLLNIMDGLLSSDGAICLFTTNHIDRLDPALLRAGRMNRTVEFSYLNPKTASRMVKAHLGVDMDGFRDGVKPAELQDALLDIMTGKSTVSALEKFKEKTAA